MKYKNKCMYCPYKKHISRFEPSPYGPKYVEGFVCGYGPNYNKPLNKITNCPLTKKDS